MLSDDCDTSCKGTDCPSFKGVAVRELARWVQSPAAAQHPVLKASAARVLSNSAAAVWDNARVMGQTGPMFSATWVNGTASPCSKYNAAAQASAVFALFTQVRTRGVS